MVAQQIRTREILVRDRGLRVPRASKRQLSKQFRDLYAEMRSGGKPSAKLAGCYFIKTAITVKPKYIDSVRFPATDGGNAFFRYQQWQFSRGVNFLKHHTIGAVWQLFVVNKYLPAEMVIF